MSESVEAFLERERGQLPPWFVVGFGTGIAAWFALDQPRHWAACGCTPRWLKLDRISLARTGGVAVYLGKEPRAVTVAGRVGAHPWAADVPRRMRYGPRVRREESVDAPIRDRT